MAKIISEIEKRVKYPIIMFCWNCGTKSAFDKADFYWRVIEGAEYVVCKCPKCSVKLSRSFTHEETEEFKNKVGSLKRFLHRLYNA